MKKYFLYALMASFMMACGDDDADPVLTITSETNVTVEAGMDFSLAGTATDDLGITTVALNSDALGIATSATASQLGAAGEFGWTLTPDPTTPEGSYEIMVIATDTGDNTATEIVTVNITN